MCCVITDIYTLGILKANLETKLRKTTAVQSLTSVV